MKRIFYGALLALMSVSATGQTLSVQPIETQAGTQTELVLSLSGATAMSALQFNLTLPEGMTAGDNVTPGPATNGHTLSVQTLDSGDRLFILYSMDLNTFGEGELLRIPVSVSDEAQTGEGRLYTVRTASTEAVSQACSEVSFDVTVKAIIPGDVNGDGNVNGADIVAVINYVLADDIAGDVNGDGNVNGADIVAVINYVLNDSGNNARPTLAQSRAAVAEEPAEILSGTKTDEGISLSLTGGEDCTAFQFMLSLPEGASLTAVTGSEERLGDHELLFRRQQDGRYLVLGYAMDNHCIGESSGELLSLRLEGNANGRATISEALIFTPQAETRYMNALEIDLPTAVSGVRAKDAVGDGDIYDLNGRKLNKKPSNGYYIQGGKKYFVK